MASSGGKAGNVVKDRIPYVYMVASSFSGSTLLAMLLDAHPEIASIGEVSNIISRLVRTGRCEEYPCACGVPIRECEFYKAVQEELYTKGCDLDLHNWGTMLGEHLGVRTNRILFGIPESASWAASVRDAVFGLVPAYRRHIRQVFERSEAVARAVLDVSGKRVFVDGSKAVNRAFHLANRPTLDLKVLHVVRDARAFARSCLKHGGRISPVSIRYWRRVHAVTRRLKDMLPSDAYYVFRWEDFCAAPEESLHQLCGFVGVGREEMLSRVNERKHHVIGNEIRLKPVPGIRSDESWRHVLTRDQVRMVERIAGDVNRSFGYE